ncbi:S8 family serine peptidase [Polyangium spumosum]|uniref:S8 family serine peptidase n=1 Tax=Polyangium spumosum TaxID=889282 RepID=A0A6N7PMM5_9BACT|nr:S8 family serine peptidase [Polyangium spumosum]MRG91404.1 S8 family serine peptidase [Polyangium spumosum]
MTSKLRRPLTLVFASFGLVACAIGADEHAEDVGAAPAAISEDGRYIVKFKDWSRRGQVIAGAGGKVARELPAHAASAVYLPDVAAEALSKNPHVEYVEVDPRRELQAEVTPYGIAMVQADDDAFASLVSDRIKVCIIDSGFHTGHEDLQGLPVTGEPGTSWSTDGCGHGTHVAGTIAAVNNELGVVGVAPNNVSLHIVKVFGDGCSWTYASDLVAALNECREAGARVVNMSLGGSFSSKTEQAAFDEADADGVLSVAAAGNGGNKQTSYPAGYASVMSVAAIDANKVKAAFSQSNADVEISAPGVNVLSTVPWSSSTVTVGSDTYMGTLIEGAAEASVTGALVDGGLCDSVGAWAGKLVLCQRGVISFADKVDNVTEGGGAGAVIHNNVSGGFAGTLNGTSSIPAIGISMEDGQALLPGSIGKSATLNTILAKPGSGYEAWDGTSMATPHVAAVAALLWSHDAAWTNKDIRNAITSTAEDLGAAGRDTSYGFGLVRARAALDFLLGGGPTCGAAGASCSAGSDCCSGSCGKVKGKWVCK